MYLKYTLKIILELALLLLVPIVVPIALLFCNRDSEHLPRWARWFEDANDFYDGINAAINGDYGWRTEHFPSPKNRTYYARLRWLLRNKIGYFSTKVNGVRFEEIEPNSIRYKGDLRAFNIDGEENLSCEVYARTYKGSELFCKFKSIPWSKKFYLRVFLGYKIQDIAYIANLKTPSEKTKALKEYLTKKDNKKIAKTVFAIHPLRKIG